MKLESILKPVKWLDEQVLRQYTKIGKKWENKGRNIKVLTIPLNFASSGLYSLSDTFVPGYGFYVGMDMARNLLEKKRDITSGEIAVDNPLLAVYGKITNGTRFPLFVAGIAMTSKALIDFYNCFIRKEDNLSENSLEYLKMGLSTILLSSSIYLKDRDPKLLDKASVFNKAYNWIKEKITLPAKPELQPVPNPRCSLEGNQ